MAEAQRTLVKSPPELWAEISDPEALARHLGAFGEIRITRTEPETTVAWEGDRASGTVELAPAGWGTKVTVTAAEPPPPPPPPVPAPRRGLLARLLRRRASPVEPLRDELSRLAEPAPPDPDAVLTGMLRTLGTDQRRPFAH